MGFRECRDLPSSSDPGELRVARPNLVISTHNCCIASHNPSYVVGRLAIALSFALIQVQQSSPTPFLPTPDFFLLSLLRQTGSIPPPPEHLPGPFAIGIPIAYGPAMPQDVSLIMEMVQPRQVVDSMPPLDMTAAYTNWMIGLPSARPPKRSD
jgi:hypothetical protein